LKWDLQQERDTGKGRRTDLAAPTEDNELAEEAPPLKSIMYLYPREKGLLFGSKMRHIMPSRRAKGQVSSQAEGCQGSALSPYLVLVVVSDDDGSVVGSLALEYQSPVYIQSLSFFGACFIRGSGSLWGSGTHLPRLSLIA
jgi:hypothetical protein